MPKNGPTLLIDGYRPTAGRSRRLDRETTSGKLASSEASNRSLAGSALTQRLPKTTSSVSIPKK